MKFFNIKLEMCRSRRKKKNHRVKPKQSTMSKSSIFSTETENISYPDIDYAKQQYKLETLEQRKIIPSFLSPVRQQYQEKSLSLNQVKKFTEVIPLLPTDNRTPTDVLFEKGYQMDTTLGKGGYGIVYKVKFEDKVFACKVISFEKHNRSRLLDHLKTEIFIMERYPHPNIINIMDHFIIDKNAYIIMEFADAGSIADMVEHHGHILESKCNTLFVQMLKGIIYLHSCHIAHRDLKLDNILLMNSINNEKIVKITDFGLSQAAYMPKTGHIKTGNFGGTRSYMAPEILRLEVFEIFEEDFDFDFNPFIADIWALGVCLYEMLTGILPFDGYRNMQKVYEAQTKRTWSFHKFKISALVKDLIRKMLEPNTQKRIDPLGIWTHPWVQQNILSKTL